LLHNLRNKFNHQNPVNSVYITKLNVKNVLIPFLNHVYQYFVVMKHWYILYN